MVVAIVRNEKQQESCWGQSRVSKCGVGLHLERQAGVGPRRAFRHGDREPLEGIKEENDMI